MGVSFFNNLPGIILSFLIALLGIFFSDYLGTEIMGFNKSPISSIMLAIIIGLLVGNIFSISENLFLSISFVLILIPFLYFYLNRKFSTSKYIKIYNNTIALILLLIGGCIYGLVETYTYTIRLPLDKICYQNHNTDDLKLNCCLSAEYVWNEGFSFSDTPPKECKIFMDWNN